MKRIISSIIAVTLLCAPAFAHGPKETAQDAPAKYIFLFIGDGMGHSQVSVTESYLSYLNGNFYSEQLCFTGFPVYGTCTTPSLSASITDSAAAGTAIATGQKTNNGMLGTDSEGNPVRSVAEDLQEMGYNIGILSSVPVNHATPAAFYGHVVNRGAYWTLIEQMLQDGFKFYGGSGFLNNTENDPETFLEQNGYGVAYGQQEYEQKKADSDKMVFLSNPRGGLVGNYVSYAQDIESVLLADMMGNAIEFIGDSKPFFMMCEGGEIDWEAHSNLTIPLVISILKMNDAVKRAYEFYLEHPDETLIVVTADHETGGVSLGSTQSGYSVNWEMIISSWEEDGILGDVQDNDNLNRRAGFAWTSRNHTGAPVPVYAIGKGAERFSGRMDNTDFRSKILCK